MKIPVMLSLLGIPVLLAAQGTAVEGFDDWSAASLKAMSDSLTSVSASDPHHLAVKQLSSHQNEYFLLARRDADGPPEWHETEADVFVVQSGSATLVVGGTLAGAETTAPHEKRGSSIAGGARYKISAGDLVRIPPSVPHQVLLDGKSPFTYVVIKVKGY